MPLHVMLKALPNEYFIQYADVHSGLLLPTLLYHSYVTLLSLLFMMHAIKINYVICITVNSRQTKIYSPLDSISVVCSLINDIKFQRFPDQHLVVVYKTIMY